jgi:hypothetical protein
MGVAVPPPLDVPLQGSTHTGIVLRHHLHEKTVDLYTHLIKRGENAVISPLNGLLAG